MAYKFNPFTGTLDDTVPVPSPLEIINTTEHQLKLTYDDTHYAELTVNNLGGIHIETVGESNAQLILEAAGNVAQEPGRYFYIRKSAGDAKGKFSYDMLTPSIQITSNDFASNFFNITVNDSAETVISTSDNYGSAGHLTLDADGDLIILSNGATFDPTDDDHIANKKYVDDEVAGISGVGEDNEFSFKTIAIAGQVDVVADSTTDTLTLIEGNYITMTTSASDEITINATPVPHNHTGTSNTAIGITDGHVLTADGADGTAWEAVPGGGGGRFGVSTFQQNSRMGLINNWYVYNQSFGTSISAIDWGTYKFIYALYTSTSEVTLKAWKMVTEFSSAVDYEIELWDLTIPSDGSAGALTAVKVGDTQTVSATAYAIYSIGQDDLTYTLAAGHQLYVFKRYTSGSGNKYTYDSTTLEFETI